MFRRFFFSLSLSRFFFYGAGGVSVWQLPPLTVPCGTPPLTPLRQNSIVALDFGGIDLEKKGEKRSSVDSPAKTC